MSKDPSSIYIYYTCMHIIYEPLEQWYDDSISYRRSHGTVMKELDLKRTQLLWETNKLSEAEAKLHQSQQDQAKLRKEQTKLRIKNQEVLDQLEQGTCTSCMMHAWRDMAVPDVEVHNSVAISSLFLSTVQISCQQQEADKKYLEDELKLRGRQSSIPPAKSSQLPVHSKSTSQPPRPGDSDEPSHTTSQPPSHGDSDEPSSQPPRHGEGESDENMMPVPALATSAKRQVLHSHRDINILEDLDKELNKNLGTADKRSWMSAPRDTVVVSYYVLQW